MKPKTFSVLNDQTNSKVRLIERFIPAALILAFFGGCATSDSSLQNVNKEWNKTIRAAHVYPVNPLTQDLQPGDIFFTDKSIEDLSAWDDTGYLPLDHLILRLYPSNYISFYQSSFAFGDTNLPYLWLKDNSWSNAPVAAFPGYTFKISQGGAMNVSLPIEGVPVGLGLMAAKDASGTVTIGDAHTYGVDEISLFNQVIDFINITNNAANILHQFPPSGKEIPNRFFLQVVSRVYTTGKVTVSMVKESSAGGAVSVGSADAVNIPQGTNAALDYSNLVNAVNGIVSASSGPPKVGGSLKFTQVSGRSVSLDETFPRPVLIGYVGFSVPVTRRQLDNIIAGKREYFSKTALNPKKRDQQLK
jgi:hypothetical protein